MLELSGLPEAPLSLRGTFNKLYSIQILFSLLGRFSFSGYPLIPEYIQQWQGAFGCREDHVIYL